MTTAPGPRPVRLAHGAWAQAHADGVLLGVLDGSFEEGWRARTAVLPTRSLDAAAHVLNGTGAIVDVDVAVRSDDRGAVVEVEGVPAALGIRAAARLQVLARLRACARAPREHRVPVAQAVRTARGALHVDRLPGVGLRCADVRAAGPGTVQVLLEGPGGSWPVDLPALELVVAAGEALRDRTHVVLRGLPDHVGARVPARVELPPRRVQQSAADAQWLLPAMARRVRGDAARLG